MLFYTEYHCAESHFAKSCHTKFCYFGSIEQSLKYADIFYNDNILFYFEIDPLSVIVLIVVALSVFLLLIIYCDISDNTGKTKNIGNMFFHEALTVSLNEWDIKSPWDLYNKTFLLTVIARRVVFIHTKG